MIAYIVGFILIASIIILIILGNVHAKAVAGEYIEDVENTESKISNTYNSTISTIKSDVSNVESVAKEIKNDVNKI